MTPTILIVDDEARYRQLYADVMEGAGLATRSAPSAEAALAMIEREVPAMVVTDVRMGGASGFELLRQVRAVHPGLPFLLVTAYGEVRDAVQAMKMGAVDYLSKPVDLDELLAAVRDTLGISAAQEDLLDMPIEALAGIVAESPAMRSVLWDAYRVAKSDATVLITGESGCGKEVLAGFIHQQSTRRDNPLVILNCASVPAPLVAAELFGHEKGAFTGATVKRKGRFREADQGTLFLDEIGDMPLDLQPTLLRALETGRITPLGSDRDIEVDDRIIAATNRKLVDEVEAGTFRQDLYYRLNVISIEIPPLRERTADIVPLARFFLGRGKGPDKRLSRAALQALQAYCWPGNVRELANTMERVRLLAQTDVILPEHLPPVIRQAAHDNQTRPRIEPSGNEATQVGGKTLEEIEIATIRQTLEQTEGNRTKAAELLGITRRGLIYKIKRLGIE